MQEQLILDAQQACGQGIVKIGKVFLDKVITGRPQRATSF